eukprot:TRINITY_DN5966_c0_g2_i3.p1 TRINITY_DN5966_c0_g2~~TRINITY_DN5966_c0_g2_i3.p1  ORF type:complete len:268 (+),score=30.69 TRINITY_DN5966_c0_g2_i3:195-998(+)
MASPDPSNRSLRVQPAISPIPNPPWFSPSLPDLSHQSAPMTGFRAQPSTERGAGVAPVLYQVPIWPVGLPDVPASMVPVLSDVMGQSVWTRIVVKLRVGWLVQGTVALLAHGWCAREKFPARLWVRIGVALLAELREVELLDQATVILAHAWCLTKRIPEQNQCDHLYGLPSGGVLRCERSVPVYRTPDKRHDIGINATTQKAVITTLNPQPEALRPTVIDRGSSHDMSRGVQGLSLIHISEPTRLLSISYAVFCLKKKKTTLLENT